MLKHPVHERPLMIDIRLGEEWLPVGDLGFSTIDWRARSAEFGIVVGEKNYWDQGYGSEAIRLLLQHGFETLNLNRISLRVYATNERARHAYQKIGFREEGVLRQAEYRQGQYLDVILMSVLKSEWEGIKDAPSQP
jgi:RimJ/RimL family protein N-acetyltransferase